MRILAVHPGPSFSVHDLFVGWTEALRTHGATVVGYNLDDRLAFYSHAVFQVEEGVFRKAVTGEQAKQLAATGLYAAMYKVRPDVLLVISGFFPIPELYDQARRDGTRVVILHTEQPYELDRELALAAHADLNLINDPTHLEAFRQAAPTYYIPHAYRPKLHHPGLAVPELVCDLGFVGTGYQSRIQFLERMDLDGLDVLLGGNWQALRGDSPLRKYVGHDPEACMDNQETVDLYRSARVGINLYRREAQRPELSAGWAMGPREVEMAACGTFFLREPRGEGDQVLSSLPTFDGPEHAGELLRWYLDHGEPRKIDARLAREAVADRTFDNHAAQLLRLLGD